MCIGRIEIRHICYAAPPWGLAPELAFAPNNFEGGVETSDVNEITTPPLPSYRLTTVVHCCSSPGQSHPHNTAAMSLSIPNAPNAGLFKAGYQKYVQQVML